MKIQIGNYVTIEYPSGHVCEGVAIADCEDAYESKIRLRDGDEILVCKGWYADDISIEPTLAGADAS